MRRTRNLDRELKRFKLIIKPALMPKERHKLEDTLKILGYKVNAGGTHTDMSECDISFSK